MQHYQRYFPLLRPNGIYAIEGTQTSYWPSLLEIGVGGEDDARNGGQSLRTWKRFFPKARIVGIDIRGVLCKPSPEDFARNIVEVAFFHNLVIIQKGRNDEKSNLPHLVRAETGQNPVTSQEQAGN